MNSFTRISVILVFLINTLTGCATYYQQNIAFQQAIAAGQYHQAVDYLENNSALRKKPNKLLYYLEKGTALHMAGEYGASNEMFEKAYAFIDDFIKNHGLEALSFITNPTVVPYPGEDFERVQIHYFKALNHAMTGNLSDALVECRRINIKLNEINDRYESNKRNHYSGDAFAWNLMGIFYDALKEYNNAFICYRNALALYETDYLTYYNVPVPQQLIHDLLKAAQDAGMYQEYDFYHEKYALSDILPEKNGEAGDVVVFWNDGLAPIKTEDSLNFFIERGAGGVMMFVNQEQDIWLPMPPTGTGSGNVTDMSFIRMALPRYLERSPFFIECRVSIGSKEIVLEKAQDINAIAFLNLQDRMGRELGKALLRMVLKQGIEKAARDQDEGLGLIVSVINAVTEKADTRSWQTLPHHIDYARISVEEGQYQLVFKRSSYTGAQYETIQDVVVKKGKTTFVTLFDPQSIP
ncbi:MAG: hypothetical protein WBM02_09935 [bacterium]